VTQSLNQTITLPDGRVLGYAQSGDPHGKPLFLFHGLNSSRLEAKIINEKMAQIGVHVIGIDRPGMGLSSFQENRTILDFVEDIVVLADTLHINSFSILGISAGAPYALACTYKIPHMVTFCGLVSGLAPMSWDVSEINKKYRAFIFVAQKLPWLAEPFFWLLQGRYSQDISKTDRFLESVVSALDDVDKKILQNTTIKKALSDTFRESYHNGSKGVAYDARLVLGESWGFSLEDIRFKDIHLWHGEKDLAVPVNMAKSMAGMIDNSKIKLYKNDGHLSLIFHQMDEILTTFC